MNPIMRCKPSPSMVVALIALFVALGGTATALTGTNTVDSGDIINDQVRAPDIGADQVQASEVAQGAVGSSEVAFNSLAAGDLGTGSVGTAEVADGSLGNIDLGQNAVNSFSVQDNSLNNTDIDQSTLSFLSQGSRTETTDDSPSVANVDLLRLDYSTDTTITNLTDFEVGQIVVLQDIGISGHPTILDDSGLGGPGGFRLQGDWTPQSGDTLTLIFATNWNEISRSDL
jgi:hypothetical protein